MTLAPFSAPKPFRLLKNLPGGAWGVLETYRRLPRLLQPPLHTQSLADLQPNAIFIQNALTPLSPISRYQDNRPTPERERLQASREAGRDGFHSSGTRPYPLHG